MQQPLTDGERRTVLVIEDDLWLRRMVADVLADEGYETVQASSGQTGLRLATLDPPRVVVLDLALPDLSGLQVLTELGREPATRGVPIVAMSGNAGLLAEAGRRQVAGTLPKPFTSDQLVEYIAGAIHPN